MNWQIRTVLAGILAALGLYVIFNPLRVTTLVVGTVPWLLLTAGAVYLIAVVMRKWRRPITMILPAIVGLLLVYAGLSMKFGDPRTVGPIGLPFLFALVLLGGGIAKLLTTLDVRKSRYFLVFVGAGVISVLMGLIVMFNWSAVSAGFLGVVLGLELIADAAYLAAFAFRDRDKEEHREALG
ncbi:hypothetical protein GCM10023264_12630 [Sphingomonas daechungensis]|uniref:DUF308 domain-containing protein n=1 Tax=Sphingomonas daechungensis TaxID=1176646 RepID=A0ABX6SZW2_9SPHN|nr:DUF308 domain-containing protein [Sphingomonas daechungensis]QNP42330.1 DUF308 domain-containing protein [Sphingomonas daechungensis]